MKKILFFTYDFPYPTNSGGKNRAYHMMKFGGKNVEIHLFSFIRSDFKEEYKNELIKLGIHNMTLFKRKSVKNISSLLKVIHPKHSLFHSLYFEEKILLELLTYIETNSIDIVHFESFYTSFYIHEQIKKLGVKQIFGTENIEYKVYEEYIKYRVNKLLTIPFKREVSKIQKEEYSFVTNSDITLTVTNSEKEYFEKLEKKIEVIPNGVDIHELAYKPKKTIEGEKILFVGNFSYFPNRDAIMFFYHDVFSKLEKPYKLTVIGKDAKKLNLADNRIECIEFIPDIRDAYYSSDVMVSPIRIGGGTNFKVLEAAACGLPILAHPARVASLGFIPDEHIPTAELGEEFTNKLELLLTNDALQGKLAKNAREYIEKNYSWDVIGEKLNKIWLSL